MAINNRVSQSVPHLHTHVVPRTKGDGLRGFFWPRHRYASDTEAHDYADRIATALRDTPFRTPHPPNRPPGGDPLGIPPPDALLRDPVDGLREPGPAGG